MRTIVAVLILFTAQSSAEWPGWRGPSRDGSATGFTAPQQWPGELRLKWAKEVGEGYSTPVTGEGLICVHSRSAGSEVVSCFDAANGNRLWQDRYAAPFVKNSYARGMGEGPFATPLMRGGALYTLGVNAVLTAYDARSGKVRWRRSPATSPVTSGNFCGASVSPLMEDGRLIVFWGDDRDGELAALDPKTGKTEWSWKGDRPAYSSPVAATIQGRRQIVVLGEKLVSGIDARTGASLWSHPHADEWNENIVTPVVSEDVVFISGVRKPTAALRVVLTGEKWEARALWRNASLPMYMSSPVLTGGHLAGLSNRDKGRLFALNAKTGEAVWTSSPRFADFATLATVGRWLLVLTLNGELHVLDAEAGFAERARYRLTSSANYAGLALDGSKIAAKDNTHLRVFELP